MLEKGLLIYWPLQHEADTHTYLGVIDLCITLGTFNPITIIIIQIQNCVLYHDYTAQT